MSDSEDDFAPSKPANNDSDDDFAPSKPEPEPKPKLKGEEKKAQETKEFDEICEQGMAHVDEEEWKDAGFDGAKSSSLSLMVLADLFTNV